MISLAKNICDIKYYIYLKDMLDKELLEIFIGIVDTELFKTVCLKVFKSKNI